MSECKCQWPHELTSMRLCVCVRAHAHTTFMRVGARNPSFTRNTSLGHECLDSCPGVCTTSNHHHCPPPHLQGWLAQPVEHGSTLTRQPIARAWVPMRCNLTHRNDNPTARYIHLQGAGWRMALIHGRMTPRVFFLLHRRLARKVLSNISQLPPMLNKHGEETVRRWGRLTLISLGAIQTRKEMILASLPKPSRVPADQHLRR